MSPDEVLRLDNARQTILVEFYDADDDDLIFTWLVDGVQQGVDTVTEVDRSDSRGRSIQGSVLTVERDEVSNDTPINCFVEDSEQIIRLDWRVELGEEQ